MAPAIAQQTALQQLAEVPGIVGSMVFGASGAVVSSFFPSVFDAAGLQQLANRLVGDAYFQEWLADEDAVLDLRYADGRVVVRSMAGSWLLVACTPEANSQLLSMSLTQTIRRLRSLEPVATAPALRPKERTALERLQEIAAAELGEHADKALELLASAGTSPKDLARAVADVEKMTRLFISKKKAAEIGRSMRQVLGT